MTPYFDRFDVCEAWWLWAQSHVDGRESRGYRVLCRLLRMQFSPRPGLRSSRQLTENGREIYRRLRAG